MWGVSLKIIEKKITRNDCAALPSANCYVASAPIAMTRGNGSTAVIHFGLSGMSIISRTDF
jgi:hypothetical protein